MDHCFINCRRVKRVWAHFEPTLSLLTQNAFCANAATIFFFWWPSRHRKKNAIARFLIKSIVYAIWSFRNTSTFHNQFDESRAIVKYASQNIFRRIKLDHCRLRFGIVSLPFG